MKTKAMMMMMVMVMGCTENDTKPIIETYLVEFGSPNLVREDDVRESLPQYSSIKFTGSASARVSTQLNSAPNGLLLINVHEVSGNGSTSVTDYPCAITKGTGKINLYDYSTQREFRSPPQYQFQSLGFLPFEQCSTLSVSPPTRG